MTADVQRDDAPVDAGEPVTAPASSTTCHRRRRLAVVAVVAVVAVAVVVAVGSRSSSTPPVQLASFSLPRLGPSGADRADPVRYPLPVAERSHPVVLAFFASWCVLCRTDLPVVAKVAEAEHRAGDGVVFIGVDGNDPPADGWAFAQSAGVTFPVGSDQEESVARQVGLVGLPDTVLVSPAGQVVRRMSGIVTRTELERAVAQLAPRHAVQP